VADVEEACDLRTSAGKGLSPALSVTANPMKPTIFLLLVATCGFLPGCATPAQTYAGKHPELSPEHRQILVSGKIPDGTAVAGMTRDEIRLVMKKDPTQFTKINGQDAWVYTNDKGRSPDLTEDSGHPHEAGSGSTGSTWFNHGTPNESNNALAELPDPAKLSTTIVFEGNRAVRADVTRERE